MCQECVPQRAANTGTGEQQATNTAPGAPQEVSLMKLAALLLLSLLGCVTIAGLLVWLAVWLQPQLAVL
jgi:hypothetical protein